MAFGRRKDAGFLMVADEDTGGCGLFSDCFTEKLADDRIFREFGGAFFTGDGLR